MQGFLEKNTTSAGGGDFFSKMRSTWPCRSERNCYLCIFYFFIFRLIAFGSEWANPQILRVRKLRILRISRKWRKLKIREIQQDVKNQSLNVDFRNSNPTNPQFPQFPQLWILRISGAKFWLFGWMLAVRWGKCKAWERNGAKQERLWSDATLCGALRNSVCSCGMKWARFALADALSDGVNFSER